MGSVIGALMGQYIPIDFTGIDFSMTALFFVIFIDQQKGRKEHIPAVIGLAAATACLFIFGSDGFLLPALLITVAGVCIYLKRKAADNND